MLSPSLTPPAAPLPSPATATNASAALPLVDLLLQVLRTKRFDLVVNAAGLENGGKEAGETLPLLPAP